MKLFGACLALLAIVGCSPKPAAESTAPAVAAAQPKPVASVLDLMLGQIDPAADFLWESVATISTEKGIEERQPRTPRPMAVTEEQRARFDAFLTKVKDPLWKKLEP